MFRRATSTVWATRAAPRGAVASRSRTRAVAWIADPVVARMGTAFAWTAEAVGSNAQDAQQKRQPMLSEAGSIPWVLVPRWAAAKEEVGWGREQERRLPERERDQEQLSQQEPELLREPRSPKGLPEPEERLAQQE